MIKWFGEKKDPELEAREAIQQKRWSKAIAFYEKKLEGERDFALWNLLGDLHMNNSSRQDAVGAWRRALEGYAAEGLHENVLGIARKILRRAPEEEDVHLMLSESYLEMEYHADCLAAFRNYIRAVKHPSEPTMKALVKKIVDSKLRHPHLLEEFRLCFTDSKIEDIELAKQVDLFITLRLESASAELEPAEEETIAESSEPTAGWEPPATQKTDDGLLLLDINPNEVESSAHQAPAFSSADEPPADFNSDYMEYDPMSGGDGQTSTSGDGKDHYDLGNVYREMKLWDAAAAEFEQARRDPALRIRASLALAECLQEMSNLQGALDLLEAESEVKAGSPQERLSLHFQLGAVHELLGNLDDALACFQSVYQQNSQHAEAEERIQALRRRINTAA